MNLKNHLYILIVVLIVLVATSCKKSVKEIETAYLSSAFDNLNLNLANHTKWIVILPGLGCHGCIQEGEAFMKDNVENPDILFILTNISSLKILQQKIGVQVNDLPNVYIDRENSLKIPTNNNIYPCIIRIENGKIIAHEFQSPNNSAAFIKLKKLLLTP